MARKLKLNAGLQADIVMLLERGNTDADTCAAVGISAETFYYWIKQGSEAALIDGKLSDKQSLLLRFSDVVTHARAQARVEAVNTLQSAIEGKLETIDTVTEMISETRLNKKGEPYEYTKTRTTRRTIQHPPEYRAAIEHLKRRDNKHWGERVQVDSKLTIEGAYERASEEFEHIVNSAVNANTEG